MFPTRAVRAGLLRIAVIILAGLVPALLAVDAAAGPPVDADPVGVWPLRPEPDVVRGFDPPSDPFGAGHRGVDLSGAVGQPVHSALAGTVTYAGLLAGRGVIVVNHGPTRTTYEPVAATVSVGEAVAQGDRIGSLELAGSHCFPAACLHWGWLRGEVYLNPLDLVGRQRVRLLPLYSASSPTMTEDFRSVLPGYAGWRPLLDLFRRPDDPATRARSP
jgi:murein DD-endopeptidase MepM/ murein hydrolase activator NlpD